jgi:hypothetical protein
MGFTPSTLSPMRKVPTHPAANLARVSSAHLEGWRIPTGSMKFKGASKGSLEFNRDLNGRRGLRVAEQG